MEDQILETHKWSVWVEELTSGEATSGSVGQTDHEWVSKIWSTTLVGFVYTPHFHNTITISHRLNEALSGNFYHAGMMSSTMLLLAGWPRLWRLSVTCKLWIEDHIKDGGSQKKKTTWADPQSFYSRTFFHVGRHQKPDKFSSYSTLATGHCGTDTIDETKEGFSKLSQY